MMKHISAWKWAWRPQILALCGALMLLNLMGAARAATFTVNGAADINDGTCNSSSCTLREAINAANSTAGNDNIVFDANVFTARRKTITVAGQLPAITENLTITGPAASVNVVSTNNTVEGVFTVQSVTASLSGLTIQSNSLGISNYGTLGLNNCTITGGQTGLRSYGNATVTACTFINSSNANKSATGFYNYGTTTVTDCTFSGNDRCLYNNGTATLNACTLSDNKANSIINFNTLSLSNCTLANNYGGLSNGSSATITNCTFSNNNIGIYSNSNSTLTLSNSIVAGNNTDLDNVGTFNGGNNVVGLTAAGAGLETDANSLPVLKDNGGPTKTIALITGSPALNTGNTSLSTDQRGIVRPQGSAPDIGAYELDNLLSVSVAPGYSGTFGEEAGAAATQVRITRIGDLTNDLTIDLRSSDTTEATIVSSAIIPAGQSFVDVPVDAVDDTILDGTQSVFIKATATGYVSEKGTLNVTDNEVALSLRLLPAAFSEAKSGTAATLTVQHNRPSTDTAVDVSFSNTDPRLHLPAGVQIPAGKRSAEVYITVTPDNILTGTKTDTITATAAGFLAATTTATIYDVQARISLGISPGRSNTISEGATNYETVLRVTRNTPTTGTLTVTLSLNKGAGQINYPATVTIGDGYNYADFVVSSVDDTVVDGTQSVVVQVAAAGYGTSTAQIYVKDNDSATAASTFKAPDEPSK